MVCGERHFSSIFKDVPTVVNKPPQLFARRANPAWVPRRSDHVSPGGEQRYRSLLENMPICMFVADLTVTPAVILDVNRRAELVYGYAAAELVGNPAARLVPEQSSASVQNILQRVRQGETVTTETTHRHRDGTTFPVRMIATLDPANHGHMIATVEDITAERQRRSEAQAIDAERLRIAHEIHDSVAQSLGTLRLKSALWSHLAETDPPAMRNAMDDLRNALAAAIADVRRVIFALRPLELDAGLFPALEQMVADFGAQYRLDARLDVSGSPDCVPASHQLPVFRIIQEGLHNVGLHARASLALVHLSVDPAGGVALSLRDDGRGLDPGAAVHPGHFGLRQMRERILDIGGQMDIRSAIGRGTELLITLPPVAKEVDDVTG
jgi:PAS domain S-box-containing protein